MSDIHPPGQVPLHEHLAATLRRQIARGDFGINEPLPRARDMAEQTGMHHNTVLKAYRQLATEGVIELRRSRGATVISAPRFDRLDDLIELTLDEAAKAHLTLGALLAHISAAAARR